MTEITDTRIPASITHEVTNVVKMNPPSPYWMETASGKRIDFLTPDPQQILIDDIAWALSRMPQFNGHTRDLRPLSMASHALWVASYCWDSTHNHLTALHALLQHANRAYVGDLPQGIKHLPTLRPHIHMMEQRLQQAIYRSFGLSAPGAEVQSLIAHADAQAIAIEAQHTMLTGGASWPLATLDKLALDIGRPEPKQPVTAFEQFMVAFGIFKSGSIH